MKRSNIKNLLFAIASFTATPLFANENLTDDLMLIEDLPVEQRVVAHKKVVEYLIGNPEAAKEVKIIAIDKEGKVYVLDENLEKIKCLGNPCCISDSM
mgnify:CR=1 FL=1